MKLTQTQLTNELCALNSNLARLVSELTDMGIVTKAIFGSVDTIDNAINNYNTTLSEGETKIGAMIDKLIADTYYLDYNIAGNDYDPNNEPIKILYEKAKELKGLYPTLTIAQFEAYESILETMADDIDLPNKYTDPIYADIMSIFAKYNSLMQNVKTQMQQVLDNSVLSGRQGEVQAIIDGITNKTLSIATLLVEPESLLTDIQAIRSHVDEIEDLLVMVHAELVKIENNTDQIEPKLDSIIANTNHLETRLGTIITNTSSINSNHSTMADKFDTMINLLTTIANA